MQFGGEVQLGPWFAVISHLPVQHPIVIKTAAVFDLGTVKVQVVFDCSQFPKIHWRLGNRGNLSGGYRLVVDGSIEISMDSQPVIKDVSLIVPLKVKVGMIGKIDDCVLIAYGPYQSEARYDQSR